MIAADKPLAVAAPKPPHTLLQVRDLLLEREGRPLLRLDCLELVAGEVVSLIGPSGCGKSTLLSHLSGTFPASRGSFALPACAGAAPGTYISRSVQGAPLFHWLSVRQNLELAAKIRGVALGDPVALLTRFAADKLADRMPESLSGGERCRASLCQVLVGNPKILLLDEPFTGLDLAVKRFVANNIFDVARESGAAVIMVTHDLYDAIEYSDRVVVVGGAKPAAIVGEFDASVDALEAIAGLLSR